MSMQALEVYFVTVRPSRENPPSNAVSTSLALEMVTRRSRGTRRRRPCRRVYVTRRAAADDGPRDRTPLSTECERRQRNAKSFSHLHAAPRRDKYRSERTMKSQGPIPG
jgi:hypothetical protein